MSLAISGMGWVTPLGCDIDGVWEKLLGNESAVCHDITDPVGRATYPVFRVPEEALTHLPRHPRLRRASGISRFAAAAGLQALAAAENASGSIERKSIGLIFAVSNGGVIYTKRFYSDIVTAGAQA